MCSFISSLIGAVIGGWLGVYFYKQKERSKINVEFSKKLDIELVELCGECLIVIEEDKRIWEFSDPYERVYPITSHKEINKLYKFPYYNSSCRDRLLGNGKKYVCAFISSNILKESS